MTTDGMADPLVAGTGTRYRRAAADIPIWPARTGQIGLGRLWYRHPYSSLEPCSRGRDRKTQPQAWINDYSVDIDGARDFDATGAVLHQDLEVIQRLSNDSCEADDIAIDTGVVGHHHGPVHVTVSEAVDEFFEANGLARRSATVSRASPREQGLGDEC